MECFYKSSLIGTSLPEDPIEKLINGSTDFYDLRLKHEFDDNGVNTYQ
jgi:hypothetical protein